MTSLNLQLNLQIGTPPVETTQPSNWDTTRRDFPIIWDEINLWEPIMMKNV